MKGEYKPIRFRVIRKREEAEKKGVERLKAKKRVKGCGKPPSGARLASNRYVIVMTSLLETGLELIPRLYRFRQRIELVFKRLKPLFGHNRIPSKVEAPAKAQVYGKLLLAAFVKQGRTKPVFPPEETGSSAEREKGSIRWSLWREQRVMLSIVVYALITSFHLMFSPHTFQRLPVACADSKGQRVPALFRSLHPVPK